MTSAPQHSPRPVPRGTEDASISSALEKLDEVLSRAQDVFWCSSRSNWVGPLILTTFAILVVVLILRRRHHATIRGKSCRWRKDPGQRNRTLIRWQCMTCGVEAFTSDMKAPKECKRELRETAL